MSSMAHMDDLLDALDRQKAKTQLDPSQLTKDLQNHAAWQKEKGARFVVDEAPLPVPGHGEILIKVTAMAINPADWAVRDMGVLLSSWPTILGFDVAGTVVTVGKQVKQVTSGDRVFGLPLFLQYGNGHAAFQEYVVLKWPLFSTIPDNVSDAEAATLSAGTATAADALFADYQLGLALPQATPAPKRNETVIVWGGSTSVGGCGIQMLVAAGYDVVATASPHNFGFCKDIGARVAVDYKSVTVKEDLLAAVQGRKIAGTLAAMSTKESITTLCEVVSVTPEAVQHVVSVFPGLEASSGETGVKVTVAECTTCAYNDLGAYLWGRFLPQALEKGTMKARPKPKIVGQGLEALNNALDTLKAGVSATKLVVTL